jgi:hypothetical protein
MESHSGVEAALLQLGETARRADNRLDGDEIDQREAGLAQV